MSDVLDLVINLNSLIPLPNSRKILGKLPNNKSPKKIMTKTCPKPKFIKNKIIMFYIIKDIRYLLICLKSTKRNHLMPLLQQQ